MRAPKHVDYPLFSSIGCWSIIVKWDYVVPVIWHCCWDGCSIIFIMNQTNGKFTQTPLYEYNYRLWQYGPQSVIAVSLLLGACDCQTHTSESVMFLLNCAFLIVEVISCMRSLPIKFHWQPIIFTAADFAINWISNVLNISFVCCAIFVLFHWCRIVECGGSGFLIACTGDWLHVLKELAGVVAYQLYLIGNMIK